ncbi:MAG: hypothetical protein Q9225_003711 [Loekoesia sp. 1 TL-2023]
MKTEGTINELLPFLLLGHLDINLAGKQYTLLKMLRYHTDTHYRWPLALRFIKGAIHGAIILPVLLHAAFAALIVALDHNVQDLGLPSNIKVFRNQTSYNRFWDGRNYLTIIITSVRNLTRSFLANSHRYALADRIETERIVRVLIAILYATKNHLRASWGADIIPGTAINPSTGNATLTPEYSDLLPKGLYGCDDRGLGLVLQLTFFVEQYIKKGFDKSWFHGPQASQMQVQLNGLVDAYGRMETIRLTPIPIAHLYVSPISYLQDGEEERKAGG